MAYKFQLGDAQLSGALRQEGTIVAEDKLTVDSGGAEITGAVAMNSTLDVAGAAALASTLDVTGQSTLQVLEVQGQANFEAQTVIGNGTGGGSDIVNIRAKFINGLTPRDDEQYDLGSSTLKWKELFVATASVDVVDASQLSGVLEHDLDVHPTGGLDISVAYDNTTDSEIFIKNVANFSDNRIMVWDSSADQFENSIMSDDGSEVIVDGDLSGSGQLNIDGASFLDGAVTMGASATVGTTLGVGGKTTLTGELEVNDVSVFNSRVTLGSAIQDHIDFVGEVSSSIIPSGSGQFDLGSSGNPWENIYVNNIIGADLALDIHQGTSFPAGQGVDVLFATGNSDLPACADGKLIRIKNVNSSAITLTADTGDTIEDGASTTIELETQGAAVSLIGSGSNWMIF